MTACVAVAVSVCMPGVARAQEPGFSSPSVDQYVESVPTGQGPSAPSGGRDEQPAKLPAGVRTRLRQQGGTSARSLENLATDPGLGAPAAADERTGTRSGGSSSSSTSGSGRGGGTGTSRAARGRERAERAVALQAPERGGLAATASAFTGAGSAALVLALGLVVLTLGLVAMRFARRGRTGPR